MKKLVAICILMLFAIFSNVDFIQAPEEVFTDSSYYTGDLNEDGVRYKELYTSYYKDTSDDTNCIDIPFNPSNTDLRVPSITTGYIWFIPGQDLISNTTGEIKKETQLVAPCNVVVSISSSASQNSTYIELLTEGENYKIVIADLKCWFCCSKKPKPTGGVYSHTGEDLKGTSIGAGKVIGIATANTSIRIYKKVDGVFTKEISLKDFYN